MMVLDAIYGISQAWSSVNPVMLVQSQRKLLPDIEEEDLQGFSSGQQVQNSSHGVCNEKF
jgi:hypothetical protein